MLALGAAAKGLQPDDTKQYQLREMEVQTRVGNFDEVVRIGLSRHPGESRKWEWLTVRALLQLRRHEEALARIETALSVKQTATFQVLLTQVLFETGDREGATIALNMLRTDPDLILSYPLLDLALAAWGPAEVLSHLDSWPVHVNPGEWAEARVRCLIGLGRYEEANTLINPELHVREIMPKSPCGWDLREFLSRLHAESLTLENLQSDPVGYATYGGRQTNCVLQGNTPAIHALLEVCRHESEQYSASFAAEHPINQRRPRIPSLNGHIVVLDQGGYQNSHIHPAGWISGVFYIAAPDVHEEAGSLRVGLQPPGCEQTPWEHLIVQPEPGKLVLFPSHFRHDTVPHRGVSPRISFAFDVEPARG